MSRMFTVDRHDLHRARWVDREPAPLSPGEVRLRVDAFALTSNNVTYAAFGDAMNYWGFFPTGDPSTGCIPVWGYAVVTQSQADGIALEDRYYGYLPMATEFVVRPLRVEPQGFSDGAQHRKSLHPVYNHYRRCAGDPEYVAAREAEQALLKPLFSTSFLIDDFLSDQGFFGARTVILSSASSKTAYGTAFCLNARSRQSGADIRTVGLTSASNLQVTQGLGCYDQVISYEGLSSLPVDSKCVYVDFSGNAQLRQALHRHCADQLAYSCSVGGTDWNHLGGAKDLPGPKPVLFFAPAQIKKRNADWGAGTLQVEIARAWSSFLERVTDPQHPWITVVRGRGEHEIESVYAQMLQAVNPAQGHFLTP